MLRQVLRGTVSQVQEILVIVDFDDGRKGSLHIEQMARWSDVEEGFIYAFDLFEVGDELSFVILASPQLNGCVRYPDPFSLYELQEVSIF